MHYYHHSFDLQLISPHTLLTPAATLTLSPLSSANGSARQAARTLSQSVVVNRWAGRRISARAEVSTMASRPLLNEKNSNQSEGHGEKRFWASGTAARLCLTLAISAVLCTLFSRSWQWGVPWKRTIQTAWGLENEAPVRTHLSGPMEGHYLTTIQAAVTSQADTYRRTMGPKSDHFVNVLAITGGE